MRVQVIAHRGASAQAPENTAAAFDLALEMGADGLETDVRATADGVLVLCHDAAVERVSDGHGQVAALSYAELERLDFGAWFAPRFAGQRLLTADEFLQRYGGRTTLVLELKAPRVVAALLDRVHRHGLLEGVVFTSFSLECLETLLRLEPRARAGWLTHRFDPEVIRLSQERGLAQVCPPGEATCADRVAEAHAAGLAVRAWGIRDDEIQERALQAGVDGMTVNWPDRLIARLQALGWR